MADKLVNPEYRVRKSQPNLKSSYWNEARANDYHSYTILREGEPFINIAIRKRVHGSREGTEHTIMIGYASYCYTRASVGLPNKAAIMYDGRLGNQIKHFRAALAEMLTVECVIRKLIDNAPIAVKANVYPSFISFADIETLGYKLYQVS